MYICNLNFFLYFLGFSFGGLLASTVTAQVWDLPYISADLLKENLACITFGQPHVALQIVQKVAMQRPDFTATIHTVYSQDDCVPQLMRFLDESWSSVELLQGIENSDVQRKVPEHVKAVSLVGYKLVIKNYCCLNYVPSLAALARYNHVSSTPVSRKTPSNCDCE